MRPFFAYNLLVFGNAIMRERGVSMKKIILILTTAACIFGMYRLSPYNRSEREAVLLTQPQVSDIRDLVILQGSIVDQAPIRLYADSASVVTEVLVKPGQNIKSGQPLMRLERTEDTYEPYAATMSVVDQLRQTLEAGDTETAKGLVDALVLPQSTSSKADSGKKAYELYSPVDCIVMEVNANVGEVVSGLLPCLVLCDFRNLHIQCQAEEDTVRVLREDMRCEITIPAFDREKLEGKVDTIMPYARQTVSLLNGTSTAKTTLHVSLAEPAGLKPGYRAEVKVITAYKSTALLVPYDIVRQDESGQEYVMLIEENTVVRRNIQTGSELDERVEVLEGISTQDLLLLSPDTVQEGASIQYDVVGSDLAGAQ